MDVCTMIPLGAFYSDFAVCKKKCEVMPGFLDLNDNLQEASTCCI